MKLHSCNGCAVNVVRAPNTVCGACAVRSLTLDIRDQADNAQALIRELVLENERLKRELAAARRACHGGADG